MDAYLHSLVVILVTFWHIFFEEMPLNMKQTSYEKLISRSQQGIVAVLSVGCG